jgi:hypothetical protein
MEPDSKKAMTMAFLIALMRLVLRPVVLSKEVDPIQKVRRKELAVHNVHFTIFNDQSLKLGISLKVL